MPKNTLLTVALCFGVGLGLAPTVRTAHACNCLDRQVWHLTLLSITGDAGDNTEEEALWSSYDADLSGSSTDLVLDIGSIHAELGPLQ